MSDDKFSNFDNDDGRGSSQEQTSKNLEDAYSDQAKNMMSGANNIRKKLGLSRDKGEGVAHRATEKLKKKAKKQARKLARKAAKRVARIALRLAKVLLHALMKVVFMLGWWGLIIIGAVALTALIVALIINIEFSRTNDANYDHLKTTDGNTVMSNALSSDGNVFYNSSTKRYELGKGKKPTQANKLYYVYYAVMASQSRWYVNYKDNTDDPQAAYGQKTAGTKEHPYVVPEKVSDDKDQYTLDGYLFNENDMDKVGLIPIDDDHKKTGPDPANYLDKKAVAGVKKMSLDVNMLYLLDSTLNGTDLGTGKDQMFFGEQFVKPVYHDSDYNFKALTRYRPMTDKEKEQFASVAHGDTHDGKLEKAFQDKYSKWTTMLDTQNANRGGSDGGDETDKDKDSPTLKSGGLTLDEGKKWMTDNYQNVPITQADIGNSYPGSPEIHDNCTAFSDYFVKKFTTLNPGTGNGKDIVSSLAALNGGKVEDTPSAYAVFSIQPGGGGGSLRGIGAPGHTGVVLGIQGDQAIIGEGNYGKPFTDIGSVGSGVNCISVPTKDMTKANGWSFYSTKDKLKSGLSTNTSGGTGGDTNAPTASSKGKRNADVAMTTPNTYKDQIDTGVLTAQSRQFDTRYNPKIVKNLVKIENVNYRIWRKDDFYVSEDFGTGIDWNKIANHTGNSLFDVGKGAEQGTGASWGGSINKNWSGPAKKATGTNMLGKYSPDRAKIIQWCLKNDYNPAYVIDLIDVLTDKGEKDLTGTQYNFINDPKVVSPGDATDSGDSSDSGKDNSDDKSKDKSKDDKSKDKSKDKDKDTDYDAQYGADQYNTKLSINSVEDGLAAMMKVYDKQDPKHIIPTDFDDKNYKKDGFKSETQFKRFKKDYKELADGDPTIKIENSDAASKVGVLTYNGSGPTDPNGLGNIEIDGKDNNQAIDLSGQIRYYTRTEYTKQPPAAVPDSSSKKAKYAIARDKDGKPKMTKGIWDYGFGTIFKIKQFGDKAWHLGINADGTYKVEDRDFDTFVHNGTKSSENDYNVIGVTSAFGSINVGNQAIEDADRVDSIMSQATHIGGDLKLSPDDKAFLDKHKTTEITDPKDTDPNKFWVSDKPVIDGSTPQLADMNGGDYIKDYVENYKTYMPNTVENKIDVVDRWKAMNDGNATEQDAANKVADIFNKLMGDQDDKDDSDVSSGDNSKGGTPDKSTQENEKILEPVALKAGIKYHILPGALIAQAYAESHIGTLVPSNAPKDWWGIGVYTGTQSSVIGDKSLAEYVDMYAQGAGLGKGPVAASYTDPAMRFTDVKSMDEIMKRIGNNHAYHSDPAEHYLTLVTPGYYMFKDSIDNLNKQAIAAWPSHPLPDGATDSSSTGDTPTDGTGSNSVSSNWGDGRSLTNIINNAIDSIRTGIMSVFSGDANWDPTMFATKPIMNGDGGHMGLDKKGNPNGTLYVKNDGGKAYTPGTLIVNGADAYKWTVFKNPLDGGNAEYLFRQIVAEMETRDARPVYYDEIYDKFTDYDLNRIVEENYKTQLLGIFRSTDDNAKNPTNASIWYGPFGPDLDKTKIRRMYGWYKDGDSLKFNASLEFVGKENSDVKAMREGKVVYADNTDDFGQTVVIRSVNDTEQIAYTGLSDTKVSKDDTVKIGDTIGTTGSDGTVKIMGINPNTDVSKELPEVPKNITASGDYFDPASLFGIGGDSEGLATLKTNGYNPNKTDKPKLKDLKKTEDIKFGDIAGLKDDSDKDKKKSDDKSNPDVKKNQPNAIDPSDTTE